MAFSIRRWLPPNLRRIYDFNQSQRDEWVAQWASKIPAGSRVLDIGAGSCPYRPLFAHCNYQAHDFAGLDPDQLREHKGYGAIDYISDILSIPVPDSSFDVILCTEVLEHVPEPIRAIKEMARILKPGGRLLLTSPLGSGLHQQPYHFYGGYTPFWYEKFLAEANFEAIVVESNGGFFKHYGQESWRFIILLAPWRSRRHLLWFPFWLLSLPWFLIACPMWAYFLDSLDRDCAFTVGYHVSAVRCL